jgi:hypothetical protein
MEYNFAYIMNLYNSERECYEKDRLINAIDAKISNYVPKANLHHIVPILYTLTFITGLTVFAYTYTLFNI